MVSRTSGYEDTWEKFLSKIGHFSPNQKRALREEAEVDPKLAMIHGLARDWVQSRNRDDAIARVRQRQARMEEERRLAVDPAARRDYIDDATRGMLPPVRIHRVRSDERRRTQHARYTFWTAIKRGSWRGRTIEQVIARARVGGRLWAVGHPYGPPVEPERVAALMADLRRWRAGGVAPTLDEKIRLYTPRAAKQIAHMLTSRG